MTPRSLLAPARLAGQPILRTQSDERLVDLVRAGSEPAFEAIVARYARALTRYCARILPEDRAEDAVQQTFLKAYDAMRGGDAELRLRPWLYRIAHNTALNALRDRALRHEELDEGIDGVERPDQVLERNAGLREVLVAVQGLPERQRDAIVLREIEGRSYDEIAAELGVTGGAVRQLLNRARHTVRAAATAVTPAGFLTRLPWAEPAEPVTARVAELAGGAGTGAVVAKVCATALVTGAVVGGVAVVPGDGQDNAAKAKGATEQKRSDQESAGSGRGTTDHGQSVGAGGSVDSRSGSGDGVQSGTGDRTGGDGDSSGPGGGDRDSSGPGSGGDGSGGDGDSSGPGSGDMVLREDSSGPGSGGDGSGDGDNSGPGGGGSGTSGSGSSGSGSSGSGSSGSGISGSGSDSSGSGSGSSGSGSGDGEL